MTSSPHHFLHQTDELHQAATQLGNLLLYFCYMLLVDLHQRLEGVAAMLDKTKTPIPHWFQFQFLQYVSYEFNIFAVWDCWSDKESLHKKSTVIHYHASPQSTLVTDAFLTGPTENTQLLMVVLTSEK